MPGRALLVGVSQYESEQFPNLLCCVEDAKAIASALGRHWNGDPNFNCTTITTDEKDVGEGDLRVAIRSLMAKAHTGDDLLFYFSGHGVVSDGDGYEEGDNSASLTLYNSTGGVFDTSPPPVATMEYGTVDLHFADCLNGTMTYHIPAGPVSGVIPLTRIAKDHLSLCASLGSPGPGVITE
jgi:hypothetical protein